jgi:HK97 gp10 family phage protein
MSVVIRGIPQTKAALARVKVQVEAASPAATRAGGEIVARAMIAGAPRDTGRLASSIQVDTTSIGDGAVSKVGSGVPYDRFVQFGTVFMAPQPYGQSSADSVTTAIVTAMASVFRTAIT